MKNNFYKRASSKICRLCHTGIVAAGKTGKSRMQMIYDRLMCYVRYGADAEDYIGLELYRKSALERDTFITARRNYKWLYKNHYTESDRAILLSKCSFNPVYASFFKRRWMSSRDNDIASINTFIDSLGEVIVKPDRGLQGLGVYKIKATDEAKRDEFINSVRCGQYPYGRGDGSCRSGYGHRGFQRAEPRRTYVC